MDSALAFLPLADDMLEEQKRWETEGLRRGIERYRASLVDSTGRPKPLSELSPGQALMREIIPALIERIDARKAEFAENAGKPGRPPISGWHLHQLSSEKLAVLTLLAGMRTFPISVGERGWSPIRFTTQAIHLGDAIREEVEFTTWEEKERRDAQDAKKRGEDTFKSLLKAFKARYPEADHKAWRRWRAQFEEVRTNLDWDTRERAALGGNLLFSLVDAAPRRFSIEYDRNGNKETPRSLVLSEETVALVENLHTRRELSRPVQLPMIIPPRPWVYDENGRARGGYVLGDLAIMRAGVQRHTMDLDVPVSQLDLDALNYVQNTAWRINQWVLDVMYAVWDRGLAVAKVSDGVDELPMPDRLPDEEYQALDATEKKRHLAEIAKRHKHNHTISGRAHQTRDRLNVALEMQEAPRIWFPFRKDFRGRIYPVPASSPNPQANDIGKALIEFSSGLPLGPDGLRWLFIRAANGAGKDKESLDDRQQWVWDNIDRIRAAARAPLENLWWAEMDDEGKPVLDDPWCFLATCHEIDQALELEDPTQFVSHLPIQLDGTCNGLQHFSAMGLDTVGAEATNLRANRERRDIYKDVAKLVKEAVERDAEKGVPEAVAWKKAGVDRKVVKRAVMTTPYGVTQSGMRKQLVQGKFVPASEDKKVQSKSASYLVDRIQEAIDEMASSSGTIKEWLQRVAQELAKAGLAFEWSSPTGSRYRQAYYQETRTRVNTLRGKINLRNATDMLEDREQVSGSSPNFVHSYDAAHLALTVVACFEEGIRSFSMVHDSFGTHARNTTTMSRILREQFVAMYRTDWLAKLADDLREKHPHVFIPELPSRGDFDIAEVLAAPYFFC